jgi:hypothetical protein
MKSNAQLRRDDSDDEVPLPAMTSLQQSITSMHQEVHSINKRVEQNQLDLKECLKYHHPDSSDDEDDAPRAAPMAKDA